MKVKVLGTGCAKCDKLYELTQQAIADGGISAELEKIDKLDDIIEYGVAFTPALVIDETVKAAGKIPSAAQISSWLKEAADSQK